MNFVEQIHDFNKQAGLLDKPYNDFLESSFQIEEALEGFPDIHLNVLGSLLVGDFFLKESEQLPKKVSRAITTIANVGGGSANPYGVETSISDIDRLDKACDAIVFAFGSIFKLGLNPEQAARAVSVVMNANLAKLSMPKDEFGKLTKPEGFVGPETLLADILSERL